jgi:hypothetical protein
MNVRVHRAVSDVDGTTGMATLRAIVKGERDARKLARLRDPRCRKSEAEIAEQLSGHWRGRRTTPAPPIRSREKAKGIQTRTRANGAGAVSTERCGYQADRCHRGGNASSRVPAAVRMAALSLRHSQTALGAYYRNLSRRIGGDVATDCFAGAKRTLMKEHSFRKALPTAADTKPHCTCQTTRL